MIDASAILDDGSERVAGLEAELAAALAVIAEVRALWITGNDLEPLGAIIGLENE